MCPSETDPAPEPFNFSCWLLAQVFRKDAVGRLAQAVHLPVDPTWIYAWTPYEVSVFLDFEEYSLDHEFHIALVQAELEYVDYTSLHDAGVKHQANCGQVNHKPTPGLVKVSSGGLATSRRVITRKAAQGRVTIDHDDVARYEGDS